MTTLSARQTIILVVLFVVTCFAFIALDNRSALDPVKTGLSSLLVPVADLFNRGDGPPANQTDLQKQYDDLKSRYDQLAAQNAQLQVVAQEVDQLRGLLNLQQSQPDLKFVSARVLYPDPAALDKFVIIDKGSADGIKEGMAVTDPNYYVGLVTSVEEHRARVHFAIDAKQSVGAQLQASGAVGIAWGMWQRGGRMELRHVDRAIPAKEGDLVTTACASEARTSQVPCGLIIGRVSGTAVTSNQGDTQTIPIVPVVDFEHLKVVAVIIQDDSGSGNTKP